MVVKDSDLLPFDKRTQVKHRKKEKSGPTRKEERRQEHLDRYRDHDASIYEQIKERAFDWTDNCYKCENCGKCIGDGGAMHHDPPRSRGGYTSLETTFYWCVKCHDEKGHHLRHGKEEG